MTIDAKEGTVTVPKGAEVGRVDVTGGNIEYFATTSGVKVHLDSVPAGATQADIYRLEIGKLQEALAKTQDGTVEHGLIEEAIKDGEPLATPVVEQSVVPPVEDKSSTVTPPSATKPEAAVPPPAPEAIPTPAWDIHKPTGMSLEEVTRAFQDAAHKGVTASPEATQALESWMEYYQNVLQTIKSSIAEKALEINQFIENSRQLTHYQDILAKGIDDVARRVQMERVIGAIEKGFADFEHNLKGLIGSASGEAKASYQDLLHFVEGLHTKK